MQRRGLAQRQNTLDAENHAQLCHAQFWYHAVLPNSSLVKVELQEAIPKSTPKNATLCNLNLHSKLRIISNNRIIIRQCIIAEAKTFNKNVQNSMN